METTHITGLCVEDERDSREAYIKLMYDVGFDNVLSSNDVHDAVKFIHDRKQNLDLLLVDLQLPREDPDSEYGGYEIIDAWHHRFCEPDHCDWDKPVLIHTGYDDQLSVIKERVPHYPRDFFIKDSDALRLENTLRTFVATRRRKLQEQVSGLSLASLNEVTSDIYKGVEAFIAKSNMPVLITGDTGVGKELLAYKIHEQSGRKGPFRAINCAAFTENLIYSELFGYVKGAFTDAKEHSLGIFFEAAGARSSLTSIPEEEIFDLLDQFYDVEERTKVRQLLIEMNQKLTKLIASESSLGYQAFLMKRGFKMRMERGEGIDKWVLHGREGGTLFLDEIADLPESAQAGVLRALEGRGVRPVGYTGRPIVPDVRIIAATNNIKKFEEGEFRHDLFWRLAGWGIELPNLSKRVDYARSYIRKRAAQVEIQGRELDVDDQAVDRIAERISNNQFSSRSNLLESGNFRHLNWLIDRACAIASFKHPETPSLTLQDILDAEKWVVKIGDEAPASPEVPSATDSHESRVSSAEEELREDPIRWIGKAARTTYDDLKDSNVVANIKAQSLTFKELKRFLKFDKGGQEKINFSIIGEYYRVRYYSGEMLPDWVDDLIFLHFWQLHRMSITKLLDDVLVNFCNAKGEKLSQGSVSTAKNKYAVRARARKEEYDTFFADEDLSNRIINDIVDKGAKKKADK